MSREEEKKIWPKVIVQHIKKEKCVCFCLCPCASECVCLLCEMCKKQLKEEEKTQKTPISLFFKDILC